MSSQEAVSETRQFASERFNRWLNKRMPPANSVTLDQRKIFILPTREGMYFALLIVAMVMAGINYQNSLIFALAFLLSSMFMVGILHTYRNLSGLTLQAGGAKAVFAGEDAQFSIVLSRLGERTYNAISLGWKDELVTSADLVEQAEVRVRSFAETKHRGRFNPGRIQIQTFYPLGLFRAWSWVDLDMTSIVYPRPIPAGAIPVSVTSISDEEGELSVREGAEDFYGLREYQPGDSIRHIAWKSYARTGNLVTKQYASYADRRVWLDWDHLPGLDREARLSRLCYWALQCHANNDEYGLRIPGLVIAPSRGQSHHEAVLKSLALFEDRNG